MTKEEFEAYKKYASGDKILESTTLSDQIQDQEQTPTTYRPEATIVNTPVVNTPIVDTSKTDNYPGTGTITTQTQNEGIKEENYPRYQSKEADVTTGGVKNETKAQETSQQEEADFKSWNESGLPKMQAVKEWGQQEKPSWNDDIPNVQESIDKSVVSRSDSAKEADTKEDNGGSGFYTNLYEKLFHKPISKEEEEKRKRAASAISGIKALGNVANAFSNLIFTGKGAPSQTLPQQKDPDLQAYSDRLKAKRDAFANGRLRAAQMDEARNADLWNREFRKQQAKDANERERAKLAWEQKKHDDDLANKDADRKSREKMADDKNRVTQEEGAKNRAARIKAAGISASKGKSGEEGNIVHVLTPTGVIKTYKKKGDGETYIDDAMNELKKHYPDIYKKAVESHQTKKGFSDTPQPLTQEQKKAVISEINAEAEKRITAPKKTPVAQRSGTTVVKKNSQSGNKNKSVDKLKGAGF